MGGQILLYVRKTLGDVAGLLRVCGAAITLRWLAAVLANLPMIFLTRTFAIADAAMGRGPFKIRYRDLRFKVGGGQVFSGIREMYVRDVYLGDGWLTIPANALVVDLGANIGNFTNLALAHHPTVRVVAVEPSQCLRDDFLSSIKLNDALDRVTLIRAFLGGKTDKQIMCESDPCYAGAEYMSEEAFIKALGVSKIDFLKCDIEGSEFALLTRDSKLLAITERVAIEIHAFAGNVREFIAMLTATGFILGPLKWEPDGSCTLLAVRREILSTNSQVKESSRREKISPEKLTCRIP